nr:hypothetical protein [Tanacetum cinerariifolium]
MSTPIFAKTHNLIAYMEIPTKSEGFVHIIDFLNGIPIKYALTVSPTIHTSCIKQFWTSAKVKKVNNEFRIQALVDGKRVNIKESLIRHILRLDDAKDDAKGTSCLTNTEIFEGLARMGYEKPSDKLTFYKAFFSPQWKFLIHTILQCLSAKTISWNEFSSTIASDIICLATNQKFNFLRVDVNATSVQDTSITAAEATKVNVEVPKLRKIRGVIIQDLEETTATTITMQPKVQAKDKGKAILIKEPKPLKRQVQIKLDKEVARQLEVELNPDINWNAVIKQVKRSERITDVVMKY